MKQLLLTVLVALTGCSTGYQKKGVKGGYEDMQLSANTYSVTYYGNGYTKLEEVQNLALRRCAELTLEKGYKYFIPMNGNTNTDSTLGKDFSNNTQIINRHSARDIIKLTNSSDDAAVDAQIILNNFHRN